MTAGDGFRVSVKASARRLLDGDSPMDPEDDGVLDFESRAAAEASIDDVGNGVTDDLALQQPAPNDRTDVNAYLVAYPETRKWEPEGSPSDGWTFDATATQYGALGEALVTAPGSPPLQHFVARDLFESNANATESDDRFRLEVLTRPEDFDRATLRSAPVAGRLRWVPDCEVRVSIPDREEYVHRYFCEIKTGDGSLERNQAADVEAVSNVADVLVVRVGIDDLPAEYSIEFRRVGDPGPAENVTLNALDGVARHRDQAGLTDFGE